MKQATLICFHQRQAHPGESSGQSIVELALMLPILVLILAGALDLGRVYFSYIAVVNSAREGARYGATHPPSQALACNNTSNKSDIVARAKHEAELSGINTAGMTVDVFCPEANGFGHPIQVQVHYDFHPMLTRILGMGTVRLKGDAQMQIYAQ